MTELLAAWPNLTKRVIPDEPDSGRTSARPVPDSPDQHESEQIARSDFEPEHKRIGADARVSTA